jgi:hypothetical protein
MTSTFFLLLILYRINMPLSSVNIVLCVTLGGNMLRSGSTFPKESINISTTGTQAGSCICYLTQPTQAILSSSKRLELPAFRYAGENCSQNEKKVVVGELLTRILWQLRLGLRNQVDPAGLGSTETRPVIWETCECISWARFPTPLHESTRSHLLGSVAFSSPLLIYDKHKVLSFPQRLLWGFLLT